MIKELELVNIGTQLIEQNENTFTQLFYKQAGKDPINSALLVDVDDIMTGASMGFSANVISPAVNNGIYRVLALHMKENIRKHNLAKENHVYVIFMGDSYFAYFSIEVKSQGKRAA